MSSIYKAFDRTVRDIKREVNKNVLKVPDAERKTLDATTNEPWGPHGQLLVDLARASHNPIEYSMVMNVLWKRCQDVGKDWRHVYKSLVVMEYLVAHGTERVIRDLRDRSALIQSLCDFQYIDSAAKDQGLNVRTKAQALLALDITPDVFILLDVPQDILVERVVGRRLDPATNRIYHLAFAPPETDEIAARLTQRSDDTEEKVKARLETHNANVASVLDIYASKLVQVNGHRSKDEVFGEIDSLLTRLQQGEVSFD